MEKTVILCGVAIRLPVRGCVFPHIVARELVNSIIHSFSQFTYHSNTTLIRYTSTQIVVAVMGHVFYSLYLAFNSPYKDPSDFMLSTLGDLEIFTVVFAALMLKVEVSDPDDQGNLDSVLVLAVSIPIAFFVVYGIYVILQLCQMVSPGLGFEATRMMYPGVVLTYSEYAVSSRKRVETQFLERQSRLKKRSQCTDVQQRVNDLRNTIRFHRSRDTYGKITLSIVETSWVLLEKWSDRSERLRWLSDVIDAYMCVVCSHDESTIETKLMDLSALLKHKSSGSRSVTTEKNFARETLCVLRLCCGEERDGEEKQDDAGCVNVETFDDEEKGEETKDDNEKSKS